MSIVNKIAVACCCSETACCVAQMLDQWASCQAQGLSCLYCGSGCWSFFAPICHSCSGPDMNGVKEGCTKGIKYCILSCALSCCGPCDGLYNCVFYLKDVFTTGVTGFKDVMKNTMFIGKKIHDALGLQVSAEPTKTFSTYTP